MIGLAFSSNLTAWVKMGARGRGPWNNWHLSNLKQKESYESVNAGGNKYRDCLYIYERYEGQSESEKLWLQDSSEDRRVSYTCLLAMYVVVHACESVCGCARAQTHINTYIVTVIFNHVEICHVFFCTLTCIELHMLYLSYWMRAQDYMSTFLVPSPKTLDSSNVCESSHVVISVICSIFVWACVSVRLCACKCMCVHTTHIINRYLSST